MPSTRKLKSNATKTSTLPVVVLAAKPAAENQPSTSEPDIQAFPVAADIKLPGWRAETVLRATRSLAKYIGERKTAAKDLFDEDDEMLYLQLVLKRIPAGKAHNKPVRLPLPHPLYTPGTTEICLFVKDHDGQGHKAAKRRVTQLDKHAGVSKVIGVSKLRTKYESFEAKRALCKAYDLFLADDRVLPSLPKLIGTNFFKKKKQPVPIDLTRNDWGQQVRRACAATYLFRSTGTSLNIRVARSSFVPEQVAANVHAVLVAAVPHIPKKWLNIQAVYLKSAESVALPLYQGLPAETVRIDSGIADVRIASASDVGLPTSASAAAGGKSKAGTSKTGKAGNGKPASSKAGRLAGSKPLKAAGQKATTHQKVAGEAGALSAGALNLVNKPLKKSTKLART